jgi:hypothetical protein
MNFMWQPVSVDFLNEIGAWFTKIALHLNMEPAGFNLTITRAHEKRTPLRLV